MEWKKFHPCEAAELSEFYYFIHITLIHVLSLFFEKFLFIKMQSFYNINILIYFILFRTV